MANASAVNSDLQYAGTLAPGASSDNSELQYAGSLAPSNQNPYSQSSNNTPYVPVLSQAVNAISNLPSALQSAAVTGYHDVPEALTNPSLAGGMLAKGIGTEAYNVPHNISTALHGPALYNPIQPSSQQLADPWFRTGMFAGGAIPAAGLEGATGGAATALLPEIEGVGALSSLGRGASTLGTSAAKGAAAGLPYGIDPRVGAIVNPALGGAVGATNSLIGGQPGALAKALGGTHTPEQMQAILSNVPAGIKAPIAEAIGSNRLKTAQKWLNLPFSGMNTPYSQMNDFINEKMGALAPQAENTSDLDKIAYADYNNSYQDAKTDTQNKYAAVDNAINQNNLSSSPVQFDRTAYDSYLDNAIKEVNAKTNKSISNPNEPSYTSKAAYNRTLTMLEGLKDARIDNFQSAINEDQGMNALYPSYTDPDHAFIRRYLGGASDALDQSMDVTAAKNPQINDLYNQAKQARQYQGEFEKLPNGQRSPFANIAKNPDVNSQNNFIRSYLPGSFDNDKSDTLTSLTSKLSPVGKQAVIQKFLNVPPAKEANPVSYQVGKLNTLNPSEQSALFSPEQQQTVNQVQGLANNYVNSKNPSYVPENGLKGGIWGALLEGAPALVAGGLHGIAPAAASYAGTVATTRGLSSALKSDWLKKAYVKSVANAANGPKLKIGSGAKSTLLNSLLNYQQGQQ